MVAIDSHGFTRNKLDFFEREREEMRVLTQATEISTNVWVSDETAQRVTFQALTRVSHGSSVILKMFLVLHSLAT